MDKPLASLAPQRTPSSEGKPQDLRAHGKELFWVSGWWWLRQLTCMAAPEASPGEFEITTHWIL